MKTKTVTIKVPIIPLPSWWTVTRWAVWITCCVIAKMIVGDSVGFWGFMALVSTLSAGNVVLLHKD